MHAVDRAVESFSQRGEARLFRQRVGINAVGGIYGLAPQRSLSELDSLDVVFSDAQFRDRAIYDVGVFMFCIVLHCMCI